MAHAGCDVRMKANVYRWLLVALLLMAVVGVPVSALSPDTNFTSNTSYGTLPRTVSFEDTTSSNYLLASEQFNNTVYWILSRATVISDNTIAPDGTTTADKIMEDATVNNNHRDIQTATLAANATYVGSIYLKAGERGNETLEYCDGTSAICNQFTVNLNTGNVTIVANSALSPILYVNTTSVGSGWYLFKVISFNTKSNIKFTMYANNGTAFAAFDGDITKGIFAWGAQIDILPAIPNLLLFTQNYNQVPYWRQYQSSITPDIIVAPDGTQTADKIVEGTQTNIPGSQDHYVAPEYITPNVLLRALPNTNYTYSVSLKTGERYAALVGVRDMANGWNVTKFNLTDGTISPLSNGYLLSSITSSGDGWYRCSITFNTKSGSTLIMPYIMTANDSTWNSQYVGDGTSGFYLWGSQLEAGDTVTPYVGVDATTRLYEKTTIGTIKLPTSFSWIFGNGNVSALQNPTNYYQLPGNYTVNFTASNTDGTRSMNKTDYVYVADAAPIASFTTNVTSGVAPLAVQFNDTSTGSPTGWGWFFQNVTGNNTIIQFSTSQNPIQIFGTGNYTIHLNATNSYGSNVTPTDCWINVSSGTPPITSLPIVDFSANNLSFCLHNSTQFTDASVTSITNWAWTFGDGNTSALTNPAHTYDYAGTFDVSLQVTNASGVNSLTKTSYISVSSCTGPVVTPTTCPYTIFDENGNITGYYCGSVKSISGGGGPAADFPILIPIIGLLLYIVFRKK